MKLIFFLHHARRSAESFYLFELFIIFIAWFLTAIAVDFARLALADECGDDADDDTGTDQTSDTGVGFKEEVIKPREIHDVLSLIAPSMLQDAYLELAIRNGNIEASRASQVVSCSVVKYTQSVSL
jgi:hypothetical protein